jgi:hypothetical protein
MEFERLLREKLEAVISMAAKHGARNPRILGSVARGEAGGRDGHVLRFLSLRLGMAQYRRDEAATAAFL